MGMYTYFEFTGELKREFVNDISSIIIDTKEIEDHWNNFAKKYNFAKYFAELPRRNFIPFGGLVCEDDYRCNGKYNKLTYDIWCFNCELKNYDDEIEIFLDKVASKICKKFIAKIWYEENDFPDVVIKNMDEVNYIILE